MKIHNQKGTMLISWFFSMRSLVLVGILAATSLVHGAARTMDLSSAGALNAVMFTGENTGMLIKGMGGACLGIVRFVDAPPCNPAFVSLEKEPRLMGSLALSNGYDNLDKARRVFSHSADTSTLSELLAGKQPLDIELTGNITFFSSALNARYSPTHTQWHSLMAGDVNPMVNLWVYSAEMLSLQWGSRSFRNFYFGIQADLIKAKGINRQFKLFELATDEGAHYLDPITLTYLSFKPGIAWKTEEATFSLVIDKVGTPRNAELNLTPNEPQAGVSVEVFDTLLQGRLDLALDYKKQGPQFGIKYDYGVLSVTGGLSEYGSSFGTFFFVKKMFSGILFSNTSLPWNKNESINTIYTQFGLQL